MTSIIPLPVYPNKPTGELLDMFREAKHLVAKRNNSDFMVQLVSVTKGFTGKIVAIGKRPDFFAPHYYIETPSVENISYALEWLVFDQKHPSADSGIFVLKEALGQGVIELDVEDGEN
jgi:hypothetical protein